MKRYHKKIENNKLPRGKRYLQNIHLTKDQYLEFIENCCESISKRQPNTKMGKRYKKIIHKRNTNDPQTYEKMFNIITNQRNVNQNHNEIGKN